ncbi:MAG: bis(5'-nucleosyl)-tetraphosphatase (symmetrical) YqeK [Cyanobacteria bacterium P01_A01_bin.17]
MNRKVVLNWLADQVPKPRVNHILRVEKTAVNLAQRHDLDPVKAGQAGLLHDLAKYFKAARLLKIARAEALSLDPIVEGNPHLLHGPVGAVVAREQFQVQDLEVLRAIANHTLGSPGMSPLSCVIFLADGTEPGRGDHPKLKEIREVSQKNLYQAVTLLCDRKLRRLLKNNQLVHPQMVLTRNWALQQTIE